jgi:hypothetical protein
MLINAWTALFFTAQNVQTLLAGEILCGIVSACLPSPSGASFHGETPNSCNRTPALGRVPDPDHHLRLRGVPRRHARLPDHLRQLLLGHRAAHRHRRHHVYAGPHRRVELPDPLQPAVDVAAPARRRHFLRARVALVAGAQGQARPRQGRLAAPDEPGPRDGLQRGRDGRHDGAHHGAGGEDDQRRDLLGLLQGA